MLKTLDRVEVMPDGKLTFLLQSGIRVTTKLPICYATSLPLRQRGGVNILTYIVLKCSSEIPHAGKKDIFSLSAGPFVLLCSKLHEKEINCGVS